MTAAACHDSVFAAKTKSKAGLKSKKVKVDKQITKVQKLIKIKKMEARNVTEQLSKTERELEVSQSSLANNTIKLGNAQIDLKATIERLDRTKKQLTRHEGLLRRRVVDIYEGDDISFVNVVLGATDMWTFLTRAYYLQSILSADTRLIDQIQRDKRQIEDDKARQVRRVAEIQNLNASLTHERDQVAGLADAKRQQLDQIENSKELYERMLNALEAESAQIDNAIRQYQSTPQGRKWAATVLKGGLIRPISGRITSSFGYRVHPILHVRRFHTGVDLAARSGTPIHCAADGVVVSAGWQGAYGNAVLVLHGSGVSTFYGHCSRLLCSVGQTVKQGQVIANVGSTGWSTGAHLHFEKHVNGKPVNPGF